MLSLAYALTCHYEIAEVVLTDTIFTPFIYFDLYFPPRVVTPTRVTSVAVSGLSISRTGSTMMPKAETVARKNDTIAANRPK